MTVAKAISEQLHRLLEAKKQQAEILQHNLEKGLGNEQALRELLSWFLPKRFGVAKGKVANHEGDMSRQLDVIIYDAIQCPTLFLDENENQILPVEGVYGVVEVKTTLTSSILEDAFINLESVYRLQPRVDCSTNDYLFHCPPSLQVFAFHDDRSLASIAEQFDALSKKYPVVQSYHSYGAKNPGFRTHTGRHFLVSLIDVMGKGAVLHMLDGTIENYDWGEYTLGMFLTGLVADFEQVRLPSLVIATYLNWIMVDQWRGTGKAAERVRRAAEQDIEK